MGQVPRGGRQCAGKAGEAQSTRDAEVKNGELLVDSSWPQVTDQGSLDHFQTLVATFGLCRK